MFVGLIPWIERGRRKPGITNAEMSLSKVLKLFSRIVSVANPLQFDLMIIQVVTL